MKAIRFDAAVPRYLVGKVLGKLNPAFYWSGLSCTFADDIPEPQIPRQDWVKVETRLGGICGSDTGLIHLRPSYYLEPFSSSPFTIGHENVATIAEVGREVDGWQPGERVIVEPLLWCRPRGFTELCAYCARGEVNLCERYTEGDLSPGVQTGFCRDTGGSWSRFFLAHESQLYRVPDLVSDENALMVEPFCIGLHAAFQNFPGDHETVLIIGAGTTGLMTLAALQAFGSGAEILVLARYPFQAEAARRLGATEVILPEQDGDYFNAIAHRCGARIYKPSIGKRVIVGGVDRTFECVGSDATLDDALRLTRAGGKVVLEGFPGLARGVDWTAVFSQELQVTATINFNHVVPFGGQKWKPFDLTLEMMARGDLDLSWMVTHKYPLEDYARVLHTLARRAENQVLKPVFEF